MIIGMEGDTTVEEYYYTASHIYSLFYVGGVHINFLGQ